MDAANLSDALAVVLERKGSALMEWEIEDLFNKVEGKEALHIHLESCGYKTLGQFLSNHKQFIPGSPGKWLVKCDFGQIEILSAIGKSKSKNRRKRRRQGARRRHMGFDLHYDEPQKNDRYAPGLPPPRRSPSPRRFLPCRPPRSPDGGFRRARMPSPHGYREPCRDRSYSRSPRRRDSGFPTQPFQNQRDHFPPRYHSPPSHSEVHYDRSPSCRAYRVYYNPSQESIQNERPPLYNQHPGKNGSSEWGQQNKPAATYVIPAKTDRTIEESAGRSGWYQGPKSNEEAKLDNSVDKLSNLFPRFRVEDPITVPFQSQPIFDTSQKAFLAEKCAEVIQKLKGDRFDVNDIFFNVEAVTKTVFPGLHYYEKFDRLLELRVTYPELLGPLRFTTIGDNDYGSWHPLSSQSFGLSKNLLNFFKGLYSHPFVAQNQARSEIRFKITYCNKFDTFGARFVEEERAFTAMNNKIQTMFCVKATADAYKVTQTDLKAGHAVICLKELANSGITMYHRAIVVKVEQEGTRVFLLDVGKIEMADPNAIFAMPTEFDAIPPFGLTCKINLPPLAELRHRKLVTSMLKEGQEHYMSIRPDKFFAAKDSKIVTAEVEIFEKENGELVPLFYKNYAP